MLVDGAKRLIRGRRHHARPPSAPLTEDELCNYLSLSREAVRKMRRDPVDPIPCFKAGRRYLNRVDEVERWARRQAERARPAARRGPHPRPGKRRAILWLKRP